MSRDHEATRAPGATRARVVLLAGPSGAGKSRLAARLHAALGWPVVRLDDFYRDADDPALPRSAELGIPDWDDPRSWDADRALAALRRLVDTGTTTTPVYDISTSRTVGSARLEAAPEHLVLAEGIFAAELVAPLRAEGLLATACCVRNRPTTTFGRRLVRDLAERRKPPLTLVRRGLVLMRAEPGLVRGLAARGAVPMTAREAETHLASLAPSPSGALTGQESR